MFARSSRGRAGRALLAVVIAALCAAASAQRTLPTAVQPGSRVVLDAHNAYPYNGRFSDRIDRALTAGVPVAIEQDLVWRPAGNGLPARSIVSHGEPFDDREPSLKTYFFERLRPLVERALAEGDRTHWPLVTLNLDLKTTEPEHLRVLWDLLGEYEAWLTTSERTADPSVVGALDLKPLLVLTGESDAQAKAFYDDVPPGARLRVFGAQPIGPEPVSEVQRSAEQARFWKALPSMALPKATNYRRWWNAPWAVVESGGQQEAGDWTAEEQARLKTLVRRAQAAGLWVRLWTVNGHPPGDEKARGWSTGYNVGSLEAARVRWQAAIAAGADFVATDQYEDFSEELPCERPRAVVPREVVAPGDWIRVNVRDEDGITAIGNPIYLR